MIQATQDVSRNYCGTSRINYSTLNPVLVIVEGAHDVEFLKRLTSTLHRQNTTIPDLQGLEREQRVIFIPFGGGHVSQWAVRFATLGCREFHLYDREDKPETETRRQAVAVINARRGCRALLLTARSLECYLHPVAVCDAGGGKFAREAGEDLAAAVARAWFLTRPRDCDWGDLPARAQRRLAIQAKRWLNQQAVRQMTLELLAETDRDGELVGWLRALGNAVAGC